MIFKNYHRVEREHVVNDITIHLGFGLYSEQKYIIESTLSKYVICQNDDKIKTKPIYRLSIIFYMIFWLFTILFFMPFRWIFTGKWYLSDESKYLNFMKNWAKLTGVY